VTRAVSCDGMDGEACERGKPGREACVQEGARKTFLGWRTQLGRQIKYLVIARVGVSDWLYELATWNKAVN
jgi:hypothetical protein